MGRGGCEVTREAADMVLTDDALESIVAAIGEGRSIDDNVGHVLRYLLACNGGEVLVMFAAAAAGLPAPLEPLQILWLNLVTDGAPALALGLEAHDPAAMAAGPRSRSESLPAGANAAAILAVAVTLAAVSLAAFVAALGGDETGATLPRARATTFALLGAAQLLLAFGCRSRRHGLLSPCLPGNRWLLAAAAASVVFEGAALVFLPESARPAAGEWWRVGMLAPVPLAVLETGKFLGHRFGGASDDRPAAGRGTLARSRPGRRHSRRRARGESTAAPREE
jgi:Ca2+-transporting ATPase